MQQLRLTGCTSTPFGSYLKALGVLRLIPNARGLWDGDTFVLQSELGFQELLDWYLHQYEPTPIIAPWNGGSGFYAKDNQDGIRAIEDSTDPRFAIYRAAIATCRLF